MRVSENASRQPSFANDSINCDWKAISTQLLSQWRKISKAELESTHHNRHEIALLVEEKYGVHAVLTENYLKNLERTLPLFN